MSRYRRRAPGVKPRVTAAIRVPWRVTTTSHRVASQSTLWAPRRIQLSTATENENDPSALLACRNRDGVQALGSPTRHWLTWSDSPRPNPVPVTVTWAVGASPVAGVTVSTGVTTGPSGRSVIGARPARIESRADGDTTT